ncbi:TRAP transporter large permease [Citreicella sp. C3M06]|uniref:TRAP transporter large permease n=1 Tax=Roseobacteraceae TaxID=2854170 RepID=UPI001C0A271B|nr:MULTISPECIES: TRAP transporter large permease [Roseobacteraceae]MBU2961155.1 TRAP transporter large permease [Citreicella sp. C3M06]MDO6587115.1 TRAP transporter large permease [Salipiger sp. 1_MG-2023]
MEWFLIIPFMFVLFALNMRIYLAMFAAILAYFTIFAQMPIQIAVQRLIAPTQNPSLLAIPFFILLGTLLGTTGIASRLLRVADLIVGRLPGGLGHTNVMLSTLMGGLSASNLADAAMMCRMLVPDMIKAGYNRGTAAAITAASALITPILPPGIALIIYGLVADVSIGSMFVAGILPGLLCAALLIGAVYLVAKKEGHKPSRTTRPTAKETGSTLAAAWPAFLLIVVIIGGIRLAIFTPTEAGAIATVATVIIGLFVYREMKFSDLTSAFGQTARQTSAVLLVIMMSSALAWIFSLEQAGVALADWIMSLTQNPWLFLLIVNVILLVFGMFIEGNALLIILVPLLKPVVLQLGIDPVHFGIIMILNLALGTLTPPVGTVMLLTCNLTDTPFGEFMRRGWPFILAVFIALMLVTFVPFISLALV